MPYKHINHIIKYLHKNNFKTTQASRKCVRFYWNGKHVLWMWPVGSKQLCMREQHAAHSAAG